MPFNGSGVYTAPAADFPVVTQTVISSTHFNNTINDIATALSTCLTKDGQQTATANINFGGFRATNVGITAIAGSVGTPAINVSDVGTGLYRSAASELAVTVAGTQRARFDSTGLIVTGVGTFSGATSTTTLTASTSVVTPLVIINSAADASNIKPRITLYSDLSNWSYLSYGADTSATFVVGKTGSNFTLRIGTTSANDGTGTFTTGGVQAVSVDTGTTASLLLKTNSGSTQTKIVNAGDNTNFLGLQGAATTFGPVVFANGTDTNIPLEVVSKGSGTISFSTGAGFSGDINNARTNQFQVLHTASATRNITITGSNGGSPTIDVTAGGRLAITPTIAVGTIPATIGFLSVPYSSGTPSLTSRNNANSANMTLITSDTRNAVVDLVMVGLASTNGVQLKVRSGAGAPTTSDLAASEWTVWRDTSGATTKVYYNNAGAIIASAAFV